MNRLIFILSILLHTLSCTAQPGDPENDAAKDDDTEIVVGAAQLDRYLPILLDKKVGLVVNQTSLVGNTHLTDTLLALDVDVRKVFAPEHGFRGDADAGAIVKDGIDTKTNLPITSLYGSNKKPSAEQLQDIDVLVFDIQDVGTRFYTYISTMHYVMEAAAEHSKEVLILDRPNPNGMYVDGPILEKEFKSFVGMHPIPILHGLTVGELAKMIVGEQWLDTPNRLNMNIVKCQGYDHSMEYSLPVKPSPNLPNNLSIKLYPSLCLFEGTVISVGRGTYAAFQQIGHPSFEGMPHSFTPESIEGMSKYPKYENETCYGHDFKKEPVAGGFDLQYLIDYYKLYDGEEDFFNAFFNKLAGNSTLQEQIKAGLIQEEIKASWQQDLETYKTMRSKYLLYK
ncbi:MAG: DUF1343 domain-containing protein [Fulvivirga sp.]